MSSDDDSPTHPASFSNVVESEQSDLATEIIELAPFHRLSAEERRQCRSYSHVVLLKAGHTIDAHLKCVAKELGLQNTSAASMRVWMCLEWDYTVAYTTTLYTGHCPGPSDVNRRACYQCNTLTAVRSDPGVYEVYEWDDARSLSEHIRHPRRLAQRCEHKGWSITFKKLKSDLRSHFHMIGFEVFGAKPVYYVPKEKGGEVHAASVRGYHIKGEIEQEQLYRMLADDSVKYIEEVVALSRD